MPPGMGKGLCGVGGAGIQYFPPPPRPPPRTPPGYHSDLYCIPSVAPSVFCPVLHAGATSNMPVWG